jgi:hypothetical protein
MLRSWAIANLDEKPVAPGFLPARKPTGHRALAVEDDLIDQPYCVEPIIPRGDERPPFHLGLCRV